MQPLNKMFLLSVCKKKTYQKKLTKDYSIIFTLAHQKSSLQDCYVNNLASVDVSIALILDYIFQKKLIVFNYFFF